ncbi:hypothetical protein E2562_019260 [Oryza meyeriana var. granulata]|uniref:Uncharacterized protein n=1 Tax=Oryza meyeriana var. granulata TaxID=110450 RepID=A0A6G1FA80_9ORYZ|nr:hypothetical protein E2562_019260 [Oryza meyeriana var. granulata]
MTRLGGWGTLQGKQSYDTSPFCLFFFILTNHRYGQRSSGSLLLTCYTERAVTVKWMAMEVN